MSDILDRLTDNLEVRLTKLGPRSRARLLRDLDARSVIEVASQHVTMGIMSKATFVAITNQIGGKLLKALEIPFEIKSAIQLGSYVLETFVHVGLVQAELRADEGDKNLTYYLLPDDRGQLSILLSLVKPEGNDHFPRLDPAADWESGIHENGLPMIRHAPPALLGTICKDNHSVILDALNKLQKGSWRINPNVADVFAYCMDAKRGYDKILPHQDVTKPKGTRASYRVEAEMILKAADWIGDREFYHQYNCDFRGRIYPTTSFLNEQSSDRSKGMLLLGESKPLGHEGFKWLCVHAANSWGNDKVSIEDRQIFAEYNMADWAGYAADPIGNPGWMDADKPWSFLACCFEFLGIMEHEDYETYESALPVFIDGSNNGVQHMAALSKDETTAPLVNVTPTELPGDVYMFICDHVYRQIESEYDPSLDEEFRTFFDRSMKLEAAIDKARGEERKALIQESNDFRGESDAKRFAPNFFMSITDPKTRRKLVKRPVMTLGYGGTRNGFKTMVLEDTKQLGPEFRGMAHSWAQYFGDKIYFTARGGNGVEAKLPGLASMLTLFETLAGKAMDEDVKLSWNVPLTNFPVVQQYRKPNTIPVYVQFMGKEIELTALTMTESKVNKRKQKTSASPNAVHSFDAAHLQLTVNSCYFRVATVHDSFGCLAADMGDMFRVVREQFVRFYNTDPLANMLVQRQAEDLMPNRGSLDVSLILQSPYAFV